MFAGCTSSAPARGRRTPPAPRRGRRRTAPATAADDPGPATIASHPATAAAEDQHHLRRGRRAGTPAATPGSAACDTASPWRLCRRSTANAPTAPATRPEPGGARRATVPQGRIEDQLTTGSSSVHCCVRPGGRARSAPRAGPGTPAPTTPARPPARRGSSPPAPAAPRQALLDLVGEAVRLAHRQVAVHQQVELGELRRPACRVRRPWNVAPAGRSARIASRSCCLLGRRQGVVHQPVERPADQLAPGPDDVQPDRDARAAGRGTASPVRQTSPSPATTADATSTRRPSGAGRRPPARSTGAAGRSAAAPARRRS